MNLPGARPRTDHVRDRSWVGFGACRGKDPDPWFPDFTLPKQERLRITAEAKLVCSTCVVREECLEYGLREPAGTWGGCDEEERRRLVRRVNERRAAGRRRAG